MKGKTIRRKVANFQSSRLRQARIAKGWSMVDLARQIGLTRQAISSFEKGEANPSYETLRDIARSLDVKEAFFSLPDDGHRTLQRQSAVNFRTLKSSLSRERDQAHIFLMWFVEFCDSLHVKYVDFQQVKLPKFDIDDFEKLTADDIEYFAEQTRRFFGLGDGPISDLTLS